MAKIFISYRWQDSAAYAGRLYDRLRQRFGENNLFMDVATIEPGEDFVQVIDGAVSQCDVLIALIGRDWLTIVDEDGRRRLDNPQDFVALEIASALARNIRVIPVLVDGAHMPDAEDLPPALQPFVRRNALRMDHARWDSDASLLIRALERVPEPGGRSEPGEAVWPGAGLRGLRVPSRLAGAAAAALLVTAIAAIAVRGCQNGALASDDFSDPTRGLFPNKVREADETSLPNGRRYSFEWSYRYSEGELLAAITGPPDRSREEVRLIATTAGATLPAPLRGAFTAEAQARAARSPDQVSYGLTYWLGAGDYYEFTIRPAQRRYLIWSGKDQRRLASGDSTAINSGSETNHLRIEVEGMIMRALVNRQLVHTVEAPGLDRQGGELLLVWIAHSRPAPSGIDVAVLFDNFKVLAVPTV